MRIAVVGSGVAGLVSASLLDRAHEVTVFEASARIGGHVHTVEASDATGTTHDVDTGFIVYNERNYPLFTTLLRRLGVASQRSEMGFSVRCDRTGLEYNGSTTAKLFAQRRNLFSPSFHRMLVDILRFNRTALRDVEDGHLGDETLGSYLERHRFSPRLGAHYLVPMGSALWSAPPSRVLEMPVEFFVRFFSQHGMLTVDDRPDWRVVAGGSRRYVEALVAPFRSRIRTSTPVRRVSRGVDRVIVDDEPFDHVVFACHADEALAALADPTEAERSILRALPYTDNHVTLHTDTSVLPKRRRAWGAWNYRIAEDETDTVRVTYDMNALQSLTSTDRFLITLNGRDEMNRNSILFETTYRHPRFTMEGFAAQKRRAEISGAERTHYCGAYWGFGFHEDGVRSAVRVAESLGVDF